VIQAAAAVFRQKGYRGTTLSDVAEALDTNRATLYYYVSGKDELLREAVTEDLLDLLEDIRRIADTDASAQVKLREFITRLMAAYETNNPHPYVFVQESMYETWGAHTQWAEQLIGMVTELQDRVAGILGQGIRDGELRADLPIELVVNAMFGMINWTYRWNRPGARYLGDQVGECFAALFLEGLVSPGAAQR
jgi:AcrR family transcriptional regulator